MKRFMVMSLTAFLVILCYVFNLGVSFYYSYDKITVNNYIAMGEISNTLTERLSADLLESTMIQDVRTFHTPFQSVIALFDEDKKLLAKTENCVVVTIAEGGFQRTVGIEDNMTDDMVKEIAEFSKNRTTYVERFSVIETEIGVKPAELILKTKSQNSPFGENTPSEELKLVFNDYAEPTTVYETRQGNGVYIDYRSHNICQYSDEFRMKDKLENIFLRYRFMLMNEDDNEPVGSFGYNMMCHIRELKGQNGKTYTVYYTAGYDIFNTVLRSDSFYNTAVPLGIIFGIIFIIAELAAVITYNRNRKITKAREAFIAGAAHELKTPLAVISNQCECYLENVAPEKNDEYVNSVYKETKRMSRMVQTLIQFNKLETGSKIKKEAFDINNTAHREAEKYIGLSEAKRISIKEDFCEKGEIKGSEEMLSLALDNLISNAVFFTPEGGEIEVKTVREKKKLTVSVYNSGTHIEDGDASHIWEELYRGDKARERNGSTGMGLAVCRKVFELHSFRYGFENTEDGVKFYFTA